MIKVLASLLACFSCTKIQANESNSGSVITEPVHPQSEESVATSGAETALIATFSIDRFCNSKFLDENIKNYLHKILLQYDLMVIQEVQDGEEFIHLFIDELVKLTGRSFKYILGERAGRKSKKNQILILYRDSLFTLIESYQYGDENNLFERPPLLAKFRSKKFEIDEFAIIGVDLYYRSVEDEINELVNVHHNMKSKWGDIPLLIMGNFMTGGSHCSKSRLRETRLKQDASYIWLVEDIDTTVLKNDYTYDRIIAYGGIEHHYVTGSTKAFGFDVEFGLEMNEAKQISDHYPVQIQLGARNVKHERLNEEREEIGTDEITIKIEDLSIEDDDSNNDHIFIGSFNIQRLGRKKMNDAYVLDYLFKILGRYDLVLIQELQDQEMKYVAKFINNLNKSSGKKYNYVISESLGRKTYREQYMYIYRESLFRVADHFVYDDGSEAEGNDTFAREPFCVMFETSHLTVGQIAFVGAHINPHKVAEELDEMINVHSAIKNKWGEETSVIFMGDFNADGSYLRKKEKLKLKMYLDKDYLWLLENTDTTLAKNDYNYDRIIVYGEELKNQILAESATAYKFDDDYGLAIDDAKRISDHYPVEFKIRKRRSKDEL